MVPVRVMEARAAWGRGEPVTVLLGSDHMIEIWRRRGGHECGGGARGYLNWIHSAANEFTLCLTRRTRIRSRRWGRCGESKSLGR